MIRRENQPPQETSSAEHAAHKEKTPTAEISVIATGKAASVFREAQPSYDVLTGIDTAGDDKGTLRPDKAIAVLGDGIGGSPDGDKAAEAVITSGANFLETNLTGMTPAAAAKVFELMLQKASIDLRAAKVAQNLDDDAGTTLVAAKAFVGSDGLPYLGWGSVGDSLIAAESDGKVWDVNAEETDAAEQSRAQVVQGQQPTYDQLPARSRAMLTNALSVQRGFGDELALNDPATQVRNSGAMPLVPNEQGLCRVMLSSDAVAGVFKDRQQYQERPNDFSQPGNILPEFQTILSDYTITAEQAAQKIHDLARTGIEGRAQPSSDDCLIYVMDLHVTLPEKTERLSAAKRFGRAALGWFGK